MRRSGSLTPTALLKQAQALGDFRALVKRGRRVIGVESSISRGFTRVNVDPNLSI